ncbi:PP0621 family protein [Kaarinaea lacus]
MDNARQLIMRTLIIIIAVILAVVIIKRLITTHSRSKKVSRSELPQYKKTVRCEHCGTHIPESSAFKVDNHVYCNENHYLEDKKKT